MSLLDVTGLRISFPTADGLVQAVRGVSFSVDAGQTLGIVGESGSSKTVLTQTLLGLTPGADVSGRAIFDGTDLIGLSDRQLRQIRGAQIAMIFQDPLTSLHPMFTVGWQIAEMIRAHDRSVSRAEANERGGGPARPGRDTAAPAAGERLPAPVLRRHAAARHDRDGALAATEADHRRRAHFAGRPLPPAAQPQLRRRRGATAEDASPAASAPRGQEIEGRVTGQTAT